MFTKPRCRAKPGGGVSAPLMIYYFPDPRGKCAKRTLREIILLAAAEFTPFMTHLSLAAEPG